MSSQKNITCRCCLTSVQIPTLNWDKVFGYFVCGTCSDNLSVNFGVDIHPDKIVEIILKNFLGENNINIVYYESNGILPQKYKTSNIVQSVLEQSKNPKFLFEVKFMLPEDLFKL